MRSVRNWVLAVVLTGATCGVETSAMASLPVVDGAGIAAALLQVSRTAAQVVQAEEQLRMMVDMARKLPERAFSNLQWTMQNDLAKLVRAKGQFSQLRFRLDGVDKKAKELLLNPLAIANLTGTGRHSVAEQLHRELYESTRIAMESQAVMQDIEQSTAQSVSILSQSSGNGSLVAQMQLAVQMMVTIDKDIRSILNIVSKQGRVESNRIAMGVTERRLERQRERDSWRGWGTGWNTGKGLSPSTLQRR